MWDFTAPFLISLWLPHGISIYTDILKLTDRGLHFTNYWFTFGIRTISSKCHGNAEKKVSGSKVLCNFSKLWEREFPRYCKHFKLNLKLPIYFQSKLLNFEGINHNPSKVNLLNLTSAFLFSPCSV